MKNKMTFGDLFTSYVSDNAAHAILIYVVIGVVFFAIPNLIWTALAYSNVWYANNWLIPGLISVAVTITVAILTGVKMFKEDGKVHNWFRSLVK